MTAASTNACPAVVQPLASSATPALLSLAPQLALLYAKLASISNLQRKHASPVPAIASPAIARESASDANICTISAALT